MIKAVIFDVDGTLADSVDLHARAWVDAFGAVGHAVGFDAVRGQIGKSGDQLMPVFLDEDELERTGEALGERRGAILKDNDLSRIAPFADVRALFERIRADRTRIVPACSAKADELEVYRKIADIEHLTDAETSSDDAEASTPEPDIFHAALSRPGDIAPDQAIVIGGTRYDAEAAGTAGLRTIGVLCGGFPESDLRRAGCVAIYRDPSHLLADYDHSLPARVSTGP